jgi:hypothetical protein
MRKDITKVEKGVPYVVEWPEYHVACAHEECNETALLTHTGEAATRKEAEQLVKERGFADGGEGWQKYQGKYWCSQHKPSAAAPNLRSHHGPYSCGCIGHYHYTEADRDDCVRHILPSVLI